MSEPRRALVTGIGGQDGSYLAELLLDEGYEVWRRRPPRPSTSTRPWRIVDRLDRSSSRPPRPALARRRRSGRRGAAEVFNLAGAVIRSALVGRAGADGRVRGGRSDRRCSRPIREVDPTIRFYQASSSEIFGEPAETPQNEATPLRPLTPYGVAKAYGHFIRTAIGAATACSRAAGSSTTTSRRGGRSTSCPARWRTSPRRSRSGWSTSWSLGDLDSRRDWGYAGDYVRAMWLMLQQDEPDDYIVATGESHSVAGARRACVRPRRARLAGLRPQRSGAPAGQRRAAPPRRGPDAGPGAARVGADASTSTGSSRCSSMRSSSASRRLSEERSRRSASCARAVSSHVNVAARVQPALAQLGGASSASSTPAAIASGSSGSKRTAASPQTSGSEPALRCRDRAAARHRLERRQAEALVQAREDETRCAPVEVDQLVAPGRARASTPVRQRRARRGRRP